MKRELTPSFFIAGFQNLVKLTKIIIIGKKFKEIEKNTKKLKKFFKNFNKKI